MDYEAIVIGAGPAGLSAAVYLGRGKVNTLVIGNPDKSQLALAHNIENYFGFPKGIPGKQLLKEGIKQAKKFKVKIIKDEVVDAGKIKRGFEVKIGKGYSFTAEILLIATGTPIKLSGISNEEELTGKGVHYCVDCDAAFYKNKKVAVIGNGNHAAEDALDLIFFTRDLTIISNADRFSFSAQMKKAIQKHKVKLMNNKVSEFVGDKFLDSVLLDTGEKVKFDGVFMACGTASALDFASELAVDIDRNTLVVDKSNMTSVNGIFAAGNCCAKCRQVAKNVGDGCNAALSAIRYLRHQELYFDYGKKVV